MLRQRLWGGIVAALAGTLLGPAPGGAQSGDPPAPPSPAVVKETLAGITALLEKQNEGAGGKPVLVDIIPVVDLVIQKMGIQPGRAGIPGLRGAVVRKLTAAKKGDRLELGPLVDVVTGQLQIEPGQRQDWAEFGKAKASEWRVFWESNEKAMAAADAGARADAILRAFFYMKLHRDIAADWRDFLADNKTFLQTDDVARQARRVMVWTLQWLYRHGELAEAAAPRTGRR